MDRNEIEALIEKHSTSMTKFQIRHFVIGDKITNYRIIKQLLMEIEIRYNAVDEEKLNLKENEIKIAKFNNKLSNESDFYEKELIKIDIKRLELEKKNIMKRLLGLEYELEELEKLLNEISNKIDIEKYINNEEYESEYWINKFVRDAQFDIMTTGRLQKGVLEAISVLPIELQEEIVNKAIMNSTISELYLKNVEEIVINKLNKSNEQCKLKFVKKNDQNE